MKIQFRHLILLIITLVIAGCHKETKTIMTVNGPINVEEMGTTLPHEHFLVDFIGADSTGYHRWNKDSVISKVLPYLLEAKQAGVKTIFECTPAYLGRDPELLQRLSRASGVNIVTNTGYYGALNNKALPPDAFTESADKMSERWISEWQNGIESTLVKPGFIKIAVPRDSVLSPVHEKIVRAAARAHLKTGLIINAHTGPDAPAIAELKIIKEEGVDPSAFIWTHAQGGSRENQVNLAQEGAWISLDNVMVDNIDPYVDMLVNLKNHGLLHRVLISHDAGWYDVISPDSLTYRGYTALFTHLKPALFRNGFSKDDWQLLTVVNPGEAYVVRIRKLTSK
ncbi:MAG: phosphotriesterase [Bacteroidales bacterium]|nr:phosphotriesterase [Bacteroidales bacterium]